MTLPLLDALARLADAGATITGPRPVAAYGLSGGPAAAIRLRQLADRLWGSNRIHTDLDLAAHLGTPAFRVEGADAIEWTERRGDGWRLFFLSNQRDRVVTFTAHIRSDGSAPELWDADRGTVTPVGGWREANGIASLPLTLDPHGSIFVIFAGQRRPVARANPAPTIADTRPVTGPWRVRFADRLARPKTIELGTLASWTEQTDPDLRFYSGVATYATMLDLPPPRAGQQWLLDLGDVANLATVRIGGRHIGYAWRPPFLVPLPATLPRRVLLEIDVANTWRNRLIGDDGKAEDRRVTHVVPMLRKGQPWLPGRDAALDPAGLLGPVRLVTRARS